MSFADWLWSIIAPALGLQIIPDLQDTNSTHTGIAYAHLTAPYTCDNMSYVNHVGMLREAAKMTCDYLNKNAPSSHYTRNDIIALVFAGLSLPNGLNTIDYRRIHPWA